MLEWILKCFTLANQLHIGVELSYLPSNLLTQNAKWVSADELLSPYSLYHKIKHIKTVQMLHQWWLPCQQRPEHHTSIKWKKRLPSEYKNKQLSQYNDKAKQTAGFQASGFFQKPSSVFFSLQFGMWWLRFLNGRKKSSCSAA